MPKQNVQENMEDKVFQGLIKKYTKLRDWHMVRSLFFDFGRVLEDRTKVQP